MYSAILRRPERDERRRHDDEHQHHHVQAERVEALAHRVAQRRLVVRLDDRVDERRDRRRPRPQRDHEPSDTTSPRAPATMSRIGRLDDLVDDVAGEEAVRRADQTVLDGRQRVRTEQRRDVGQAAQHSQQQRRQRQRTPERRLRGLREDRVVPTLGQRPLGDAPDVVARRLDRRRWSFMTTPAFRRPRITPRSAWLGESVYDSTALTSSTAASSTSLASCSLA